MTRWYVAFALMSVMSVTQAQSCGTEPVQAQFLGSAGAELTHGRAAFAMLVWLDGKPRVLVDAGPGTALRLVEAGADISDLDAILFTQLRAERTGDLAALLQLSSPTPRTRPLPIYGPTEGRGMPSTVSLVRALFDPVRGAWRHLGDLLSPLARGPYKLEPHDVRPHPSKLGVPVPRPNPEEVLAVFETEALRISAIAMNVGATPTISWRIQAHEKQLVVSADTGTDSNWLGRFAHGADMLVVPYLRPEDSAGAIMVEKPATALGNLARGAAVKQLVLAPRSRPSLGYEDEARESIRRRYTGGVVFPNDLDCLTP